MVVLLVLLLDCGFLFGCVGRADTPTEETPPAPQVPAGKPALGEPTGPLTLSEAIAVVLLRNPDLAVFAWEVRAAEARLLRAGLLPNPAIGLEFEDVGGSGVASGFDSTETTLALSQVIEFGGKRMKRRGLAATDRDLRIWDYEAKRVDVLTAVAAAYVEVLADQQRLALARETVALRSGSSRPSSHGLRRARFRLSRRPDPASSWPRHI